MEIKISMLKSWLNAPENKLTFFAHAPVKPGLFFITLLQLQI